MARLFQSSFRAARTHPASLEAYLGELFLEDPWAEPDLPSRVYVGADGSVAGFIGALPTRMAIRGEPVRALTASTLMVADPGRNPTVGARLLRSFLTGPQDLSLTDTASPVVRAMWTRLGGMPTDAFGQDWWLVLRPASFAALMLDRKRRLSFLLDRLPVALDRLTVKIMPLAADVQPPVSGFRSEDMDAGRLGAHIAELDEAYSLRPAWDDEALFKRLRDAGLRSDGTRLFGRAVYRGGREAVGWYLYQLGRGMARVLDLRARPGAHDAVLRDLVVHAQAGGAVAIRGRSHPRLAGTLLQYRCFYTQKLSTAVHTRRPEILDAVRSGDAILTGLVGDTWTRLFDDAFE